MREKLKKPLTDKDRDLLEHDGQQRLPIEDDDDGLDIPPFLRRPPPGNQGGGTPASA